MFCHLFQKKSKKKNKTVHLLQKDLIIIYCDCCCFCMLCCWMVIESTQIDWDIDYFLPSASLRQHFRLLMDGWWCCNGGSCWMVVVAVPPLRFASFWYIEWYDTREISGTQQGRKDVDDDDVDSLTGIFRRASWPTFLYSRLLLPWRSLRAVTEADRGKGEQKNGLKTDS